MFSQCVANTVDGFELKCNSLQNVKVLFFFRFVSLVNAAAF